MTGSDQDGTWERMFDGLAELARPLLDAGWRVVATETEESWEHGDSVFWDLEREGELIELEYYDDGQLVAYPMGEGGDEGSAEPYFSWHGAQPAAVCSEFGRLGWI